MLDVIVSESWILNILNLTDKVAQKMLTFLIAPYTHTTYNI